VRLERTAGQPGTFVGSLQGAALAELEHGALDHAASTGTWNWRSDLGKLLQARDFGERAALWAERCFESAGLVVVDARSARLRQLGVELFERYQAAHRDCTQRLHEHGKRLRELGLPTPLHDEALASGLFRLEGERRTKLRPDEIERADIAALQPSVLLRPLWQDALLAPRAAILGPSELAYHAQLSPLYAALQVRAAAALPRAKLLCLPQSVLAADPQLPRSGTLWRQTQAWLQEHAFSDIERAAVESYDGALSQAFDRLTASLPELDAALRVAAEERQRAHLNRLRESLLPIALARRGPQWQHLAAWCAVGSVEQERAYALAALWQRFGPDEVGRRLLELAEQYPQTLSAGTPASYLATFCGSEF
jgi:hypothetical protein